MKPQAWQGHLAKLVPRQKFPPSSRFRPLKASLKACSGGQWLRSEDLMTLTLTLDPGTRQHSIAIVNNHVYERHSLYGLKIIVPKVQAINPPVDVPTEPAQSALFMTQEGIFAFKFLRKAFVSTFLKAVKEASEFAQASTERPAPAAQRPQAPLTVSQAPGLPSTVAKPEKLDKTGIAMKSSSPLQGKGASLPPALHSRVQEILKDPSFPDFFKQIEQAWALSYAFSPPQT